MIDFPNNKLKALLPATLKQIERQNSARSKAGLPLIKIKNRRCLLCGESFESAGLRNCGCQDYSKANSLSGYELM